MIALKRDKSGGSMVTNMANSKHKWLVYNFSTKYHFNPPYIDIDMVNGVDGMNIEVLGGCLDETIV